MIGLIYVAQFLLGLTTELLVLAVRTAGSLPQFEGPADNISLGGIGHSTPPFGKCILSEPVAGLSIL
jgi:hypothetical protein